MRKAYKFLLIASISIISIGMASAQCTASFTFTDNGSGDYSFESTSISPDSNLYHVWEFGDGTYGSTPTPNHTYSTSGTYVVCLTVNDTIYGGTCTSTVCDSFVVSIGSGTPCAISAGISYVDNGSGNYTFTSTTLGNAYNTWNFGDGSSDAGNSVNHTFAANGTYVVSLLSHDSLTNFGCYDYATVTVVVTGVPSSVPCQAGFVLYTDSLFNGVLAVNSSTGSNLFYYWDFGDGNYSTQQYPNYTYNTSGPFLLCLTVTDSLSGGTCSSAYCDSIGINGLVLKAASGFNLNVNPPQTVGIEEPENVSKFEVFPNPVKNNININFNLVNDANVQVFFTDMLGNKVASVVAKNMNSGNNKVSYNVSNIANGIYLLNIKTENSLQVKKIIVNK